MFHCAWIEERVGSLSPFLGENKWVDALRDWITGYDKIGHVGRRSTAAQKELRNESGMGL